MNVSCASSRLVVPLGSVLALAACTPFALSPPARTLPLESAATLEPGDLAVQVAGGYDEGVATKLASAAARARVGLVPMLEAQLDATYVHIEYEDERSPHLGAGRLGLKVAPIEHLAFTAGLGFGSHAHGAFAAIDGGAIVAYENRYLVPWTALRGFVSLPIDPHTITVQAYDDDGELRMFVMTPPDTWGWQLSTGVRLPIPIDEERGIALSVLVGGAYQRFHSLTGTRVHEIVQFESGIEIVVDP